MFVDAFRVALITCLIFWLLDWLKGSTIDFVSVDMASGVSRALVIGYVTCPNVTVAKGFARKSLTRLFYQYHWSEDLKHSWVYPVLITNKSSKIHY